MVKVWEAALNPDHAGNIEYSVAFRFSPAAVKRTHSLRSAGCPNFK